MQEFVQTQAKFDEPLERKAGSGWIDGESDPIGPRNGQETPFAGGKLDKDLVGVLPAAGG
jgi:hypothetical protein